MFARHNASSTRSLTKRPLRRCARHGFRPSCPPVSASARLPRPTHSGCSREEAESVSVGLGQPDQALAQLTRHAGVHTELGDDLRVEGDALPADLVELLLPDDAADGYDGGGEGPKRCLLPHAQTRDLCPRGAREAPDGERRLGGARESGGVGALAGAGERAEGGSREGGGGGEGRYKQHRAEGGGQPGETAHLGCAVGLWLRSRC
mmetsp:Transcript_19369/g.47533  ORF Transcript_19369/g.47533 Transcript_19369/m.47533 type:complete len:206 (+) Transcript_19369:29-646(+)